MNDSTAHTAAAERLVLQEFFAAQVVQDHARLMDCWHGDGVMSTPYAPAPLPREYTGKVAIAAMFHQLFRIAVTIEVSSLEIIATEISGHWLAKWDASIPLRSGGVLAGSDIGVFRLRDGLITNYTEYFDSIAIARAYGFPLS
jgi:ketosteroid isomerase-like protein